VTTKRTELNAESLETLRLTGWVGKSLHRRLRNGDERRVRRRGFRKGNDWVWRCMPVIPALQRLRQEDFQKKKKKKRRVNGHKIWD
jgi:hypothetical protein